MLKEMKEVYTSRGVTPAPLIGNLKKDEFKDVAYNMEKGDISNPVDTKDGFHIIKVKDIRDTEGSTEELVDEDLYRELVSQQVDETQIQEITNKIINDSQININIEEFNDILVSINPYQKKENTTSRFQLFSN